VGADVMKPIAAPIVGGMITSTIHVLILVVVIENSVRAENAKISSACRHSLLEKLIEVSVQQRCNGAESQSVECREKSGLGS
jgi:hypothetical protein